MDADSETLVSSGGTYTLTCPPDLVDVVRPYIDAVDAAFPTLKECFGREPKTKKYDVTVLKPPAKSGTSYWEGGNIQLVTSDATMDLMRSERPECLRGGLVFETIHGFLEPARLPRDNANRQYGKNRLGETFSLIIEIRFLEQIGDVDGANHFRYGGKWGPRFLPLLFALLEIYDQWGIEPFQRLFHRIEDEGAHGHLLLDQRVYGHDRDTPFTPDYMRRVGQLFRETARIDVFDILDSRDFRMAASLAFAARPSKRPSARR